MQTFKDSNGQVWTVRITPRVMRNVLTMTDGEVNLGTICQDDFKGLFELVENEVNLCTTLYAICKDECLERNVGIEDFLDAIVGENIDEAVEAILGGLIDMYPSRKAEWLRTMVMYMKAATKTSNELNQQLQDGMESTSTD